MASCIQRRYELGLERANNIITGDLLTTEMGVRTRTRYVIVLYAEGPRVGPGERPRADRPRLGRGERHARGSGR